ncbi:hypothetical protein ACFX13_030376 [Malus domestica]
MSSMMMAKFAFFTPNLPSYKPITDDHTGLLLLSPFSHRENVEVLKLPTRHGIKVVAIHIRHPLAISTLLYSHGNAADLGHMYELFTENESSESQRSDVCVAGLSDGRRREKISVSFQILKSRTPCNFLVFDEGFDSLMWAFLNPRGTTLRGTPMNLENTFFSVKRIIGRRMSEVDEESKQSRRSNHTLHT